jgi:hypothetical protein
VDAHFPKNARWACCYPYKALSLHTPALIGDASLVDAVKLLDKALNVESDEPVARRKAQ